MADYSLKRTADHLASKGRYGDTMLVHMNRHEVEGLAKMTPGGKLTINPDTGQPEAFLPFLLPLLGGLAGSTLLPGAVAGLGLGTLSAGLGGAIGGGLASMGGSLAQGKDIGSSLGQGIASGLLSYGLGSAVDSLAGGAGEAATAAANPMQNAATQAAMPNGIAPPLPDLASGGAEALSVPHQVDMPGVDMPQAPQMAPGVAPQGGYTGVRGNYTGVGDMTPSQGLGGVIPQGRSAIPMPPNTMSPSMMEPLGPMDQAVNRAQLAGGNLANDPGGALWNTFGKNWQSTTMPIAMGLAGMDMNMGGGQSAPGVVPPMEQRRPDRTATNQKGPFKAPPMGYRPGTDPEWNYFPKYADGGAVRWPDSAEALAEQPGLSVEEAEQMLLDWENYKSNQKHLTSEDMGSRNPFDDEEPPVLRYSRGGNVGRAISGPGGGLADAIPAQIDGRQPAALSSGEYVVPAHAVSGLGDGSTEHGVRQLDQMVDGVMQRKYGTKNRKPRPMKSMRA